MAWTLPVLIASSVAVAIGAPLWLLHRQRRRLAQLATSPGRSLAPEGEPTGRELEEWREGLADGLLVAEFETLILVSLNQALLDLLGHPRARLLGARLEAVIAPEALPPLLDALRDLPENQSFFLASTPCLGADGTLVMADLGGRRARINGRDRLLLSLRPANAGLTALRSCCQDQTPYRSLVEATFDGYFVADLATGRFLHLNQAIREILALAPEDGPALGIWDVLSPEEHPRARQRLEEMLRQDPARSPAKPMVYATLRADGARRIMEVASSLTTFQGKPAVQGLVRDITEFENLQIQLQHAQKLQAVGALAGGVAHEFNNLLMALGGYLQLLRGKLVGQDEALVYVEKMDVACQRASGLTRQVLSLSRQKARRRQVVDVNQVVREVHDLLRQTLPPAIALVCELAPDLPPVLADPGQIQQVLLNLGINARDALPNGGCIRFITRLAVGPKLDGEGQPSRVVLEVADDGAGMTAEVRERIFEPFFTTKATGRGTGLGLAVVQSMVCGMDGEITVASRPGKGSRFCVELPTGPRALAPGTTGGGDPATRRHGRRSNGERVLVVGLDLAIREILRELLDGQGYRVLVAGDGREALALLERMRDQGQSPDLVLLDLPQPGLDGDGLLLRGLAAEGARFPILAFGGQGQALPPEIADRVREFLDKPLDMSHILERVDLALRPETVPPCLPPNG